MKLLLSSEISGKTVICFFFLSMQSSHVGLAKEKESPRFQAILRVTSGRKKKAHDIKSFSHELNSKGVRPFPVWRSRAVGHMEVRIASSFQF